MKLNPAPVFRSDVKLTVPGESGPATVGITWRHKCRADLNSWLGKPLDMASRGEDLSDEDYLGEVIADWAGIADDGGQPVAYSIDALRSLLSAYLPAGAELRDAYVRALTESRSGN